MTLEIIESDCLGCLTFSNNKIVETFLEHSKDKGKRVDIILLVECARCGKINKLTYEHKRTTTVKRDNGAVVDYKINYKGGLKNDRPKRNRFKRKFQKIPSYRL